MREIIEGLKKKDKLAFKRVMDQYKNKIYNYLRLMLNNEQTAEELTQDTFVKVYFKAHTLKTENLKAWIYTIATNLARSEFRKKKVKALFSLSDIQEINFSYNPSYEDEMVIKQLLAALPEKYRVPIIMKEFTSFSFEEISDILNKPVGTVKTLVFRGKLQLKKNMKENSNISSKEMRIVEEGVKNEIY